MRTRVFQTVLDMYGLCLTSLCRGPGFYCFDKVGELVDVAVKLLGAIDGIYYHLFVYLLQCQCMFLVASEECCIYCIVTCLVRIQQFYELDCCV